MCKWSCAIVKQPISSWCQWGINGLSRRNLIFTQCILFVVPTQSGWYYEAILRKKPETHRVFKILCFEQVFEKRLVLLKSFLSKNSSLSCWEITDWIWTWFYVTSKKCVLYSTVFSLRRVLVNVMFGWVFLRVNSV